LIIENRKITEFEGSLTSFLESREKQKSCMNIETERVVLQMRITEIISKLSMPDANKEALEEEYLRLIKQLS